MATKVRPLIRLSTRSYATLKSMSKESKRPMSKIAEDAIRRYERDRFWEEVNRQFDSWTPEQKRSYRKEFREWETATIMDGLEPEDWSDERRAQAATKAAPRRRVVGRSRPRPRS